MNKKYIIGILILVAIVAGVSAYFTSKQLTKSSIKSSQLEKICVDSDGEWVSKYKECTWLKENSRIYQLASRDKEYCINQGWRWNEGTCGNKMRCADHCSGGSIAKTKCQEINGQFDECASPCRHSGGGICMAVCEEVCTLK